LVATIEVAFLELAEGRSLAAAVTYLGHRDRWMLEDRAAQESWRFSNAIRATVKAELRPWSRFVAAGPGERLNHVVAGDDAEAQGTPVRS